MGGLSAAWLLAGVAAAPTQACPIAAPAADARLSPAAGRILVGQITADRTGAVRFERARATRARLETAVFADPPDWPLIERLQADAARDRADEVRVGYAANVRLLRALDPRDRAIYLREITMDVPRPLPISAGMSVEAAAMRQNAEAAEHVRLGLRALAACPPSDPRPVEALLAERLTLELERRKLVDAWAAGLFAGETPAQRLARLRKDYRPVGAPIIVGPQARSGDRPDGRRGDEGIRPRPTDRTPGPSAIPAPRPR